MMMMIMMNWYSFGRFVREQIREDVDKFIFWYGPLIAKHVKRRMLFTDLSHISMIIMIVNASTLNQSLAAEEVARKENVGTSGINRRRISHLDPIILKLTNVVEKYELKKKHLEDLYMGVIGCGLSRCEKFQNLIPENQRLRHLKCFERKNGFKKMASRLLSSFRVGVRRIEKSFQVLINFEKLPNLTNGRRRKILKEFKIDVKTLNVEIESAMTNERLNFSPESNEIPISSRFNRPENQTHLMIYEWRIIQAARKFLRDWQRNLKKLKRCWKKRRQRNRERQIQNG